MADAPADSSSTPRRSEDRRSLTTPVVMVAIAAAFAVASMVAAALAVTNIHEADFADPQAETMMLYLANVPSILLGLISVVLVIAGAVRWGMHGHDGRGSDTAQDLDAKAFTAKLDEIAHNQLLSETAKKLAYRQEDLEALRRTIRKDIDAGEFDAALVLVNEMAVTYGFKEEAEAYREQVLQARAAGREAKVTRAIERFHEILERHDFQSAALEADKIERLYPESERVRVLKRAVAQAREQYKHDIERQFLESRDKGDYDTAAQLLPELDKYLTPQEAEPFREIARDVLGHKRDNLGVQFKMAVQDKDWNRSVRVGEQIIRDFPNSRMADEVRGMIDLLRERAAGQKAATATA